jgi:Leucine-rich repeat (LRR) protein
MARLFLLLFAACAFAAGPVSVNWRGRFVSDADLDEIARMPQVERVDLSLTRVSDLGLLRLKGLRNVRELNLFFAEWITDEGLAVLKDWPKIETLNLRGTKVTDNTLALIAGKQSITSLDIGYAEVTDSGLQHLARLKNLRRLGFGGNKMTDVGMEVLRSLPGLTHLDISGKQRTDSGLWFVAVTDLAMDTVAALPQLRELNLSGTQITAKGLDRLTGLKQLEKLNLYGCKRITDDALERLNGMPALRSVDLGDTGVTLAGFDKLAKVDRIKVHGRPESITAEAVEVDEREFRVTRVPGAAAGASATGGIIVPLAGEPAQHMRVDLKNAANSLTRYVDATPTAVDGFVKVVLDNELIRITRLSCESRRSCGKNEFRALDIRLNGEARNIGETLILRAGAAERFNEGNQQLDLVRIEIKARR